MINNNFISFVGNQSIDLGNWLNDLNNNFILAEAIPDVSINKFMKLLIINIF